MSNLVQKLLKNPSHRRIFTSFINHQNPPNLVVPPSLLHQPHHIINHTTKIEVDFINPNPEPEVGFQSKEKLLTDFHQELQIYPSFPFGFCLNPISASGFEPSPLITADGFEESDESRTVWADSVKKKRKKKMNKHKLKKLKKRLRRKT